MAEAQKREGGEDVVVGLVAVLPFKVQHLKQVSQLVVTQARPHQAYILQCVEITGTRILQFKTSVLAQ